MMQKKAVSTGPWQTQLTTELRNVIKSTYRSTNNSKFRGITVTMQLHGNIFEGIKGLKLNTDYIVVDNKVTIKKAYLETLKKDTALKF